MFTGLLILRKKNIMEPLDLISNYNIYYIFNSTSNTFTYISSFAMKNNYLEIKGIFIVLSRVPKLMNNIELGRIHCCFSRYKPIMPCKKLQEKLVWISLQIGSHIHFGQDESSFILFEHGIVFQYFMILYCQVTKGYRMIS